MAINYRYFDAVEYIKKLRNAGATESMAEVQAQEMQHIIQDVIELTTERTTQIINSKEAVTKGDLHLELEKVRSEIRGVELKLQKEIIQLRYDSLKFIIWTGVGVVIAIGGMLAKGFHWF